MRHTIALTLLAVASACSSPTAPRTTVWTPALPSQNQANHAPDSILGSNDPLAGNSSGDDEPGCVASSWATSTIVSGVSTLSGGEALAVDPGSGSVYVKSLQDPLGAPVQIYRISAGLVSPVATLSNDVQNSDISGVAFDPLTHGLIVTDEEFATFGSRISVLDPITLALTPLFDLPWTTNPASNGTGQEQYAISFAHPELLYFWDSTLSTLFELDRNNQALRVLLTLDDGTTAGHHLGTYANDIAFDEAARTLLVSDAASGSVFEVDPSVPASVTTVFTGLTEPHAITIDASSGTIFVASGFTSIFAGVRGSAPLEIASGFSMITDVAVSPSGLLAVDKSLNTLFLITPPCRSDEEDGDEHSD